MAKKAPAPPHPWEDRWNEPSIEELLKPFQENMRKVVDLLREQLDQLENVEAEVRWHGMAWKWTIQYSLTQDVDPDRTPMCYVVPNPEGLIVSIPMSEEVIATLPMRRLNRYIRDAVRSSKRAETLHWATWTPTAMTEVEHLIDLVKRKRKAILADRK